jgi:hypothetical protein
MQRFETVFDVDAPPKKVWGLLHMPPPADAPSPRKVEYPGGHMEIWSEGDSKGEGLVRTCVFRVPRYLLSGGSARSWEVVWRVVPLERAHYRGVGKPLWSRGEGWHQLESLDDGTRTRLTFVETYHVMSPILRPLLEKRVHKFISRDNHKLYLKLLGYLGPAKEISSKREKLPNPPD